jgi:hypothetical protein
MDIFLKKKQKSLLSANLCAIRFIRLISRYANNLVFYKCPFYFVLPPNAEIFDLSAYFSLNNNFIIFDDKSA